MDLLKDKVILLTGGTGSFGNKFTDIVLNEHDPSAIRVFSRGEKHNPFSPHISLKDSESIFKREISKKRMFVSTGSTSMPSIWDNPDARRRAFV